MKNVNLEFLLRVLQATGFDYCDSLWWRCDAPEYDPATLFINCSDFFHWACSDSVEVTPENVHILEESIRDCRQVTNERYPNEAPLLFCSRVRGMRPQKPYYEALDAKLWRLFDACGPDRAVICGGTN